LIQLQLLTLLNCRPYCRFPCTLTLQLCDSHRGHADHT